MKSTTPLICDEVVDCISGGRLPSEPELYVVAERIWTDCGRARSAITWGDLAPEAPERVVAVRAAHVALCGSIL